MKIPSALNKEKTEAREYQTENSGIFFKVDRLLYKARSRFQTIEIIRNKEYGRVLLLDGLVQTTELDEFYYHEMLVHPAMALHPKPRTVLIIGGGDGGAMREVLKYPVKKVAMVEIDALVVEACRKHFPWLEEDFKDGRAEFVIDDGNEFVRRTADKFDVIIVDSSDPVGPSTILHAKSFFLKLKNRLNAGGIVAAQAGSLMFHLESHSAKSRFLGRLFRHVHFYTGPVPTYPGGAWCYNFLSDKVNPLGAAKLKIPKGLKYYNADIHKAAFALPAFFKQALKTGKS